MAATLPDETRMGAVTLGVADLDRSIAYYRDVLGLQVHGQQDGVARLGAGGEDLVVLHHEPGAVPFPARGATGLYHLALLLPTRPALARFLLQLARDQTPVAGLSDHLVSEAIYLTDPDGNGIEVYADKPRAGWPRDASGTLRMDTLPLDTDAVIAELDDPVGAQREGFTAPPATTMGHVHLHVADVDQAERFYLEVIGLERMLRFGPQASFVSAGGYHHHLGMNTWAGRGVPPAPQGTAGLRSFEVVLPDRAATDAVMARAQDAGVAVADGALSDPSGNRLRLRTAG